jgi:hypothetical protein
MILTKKVLVKLNPSNMKFLSEFGIVGKKGDEVEIDINFLLKNSKVKIQVSCDVCSDINLIIYSNYNKQTNNNSEKYYCKNCKFIKSKKTNLEKYGFENPIFSEIVKNKTKRTNLKKYGVENVFQSDLIKEKIKETNLEKWGVESYTKTDDYKEKSKKTKSEKYGDPHFNNRDLAKKTNLERWGVQSILELDYVKKLSAEYRENNYEDILNKLKQTNLERYGVENVFQSCEIRDKIKKTNLEKYGVEYILKSTDIKEKIKNTNMERYGVDNPSKSNLIITKKIKTFNDKLKKKYNIIDIEGNNLELFCEAGHRFKIEKSLFYNRKRHNVNCCTICLPINSISISGRELEIYNFIENQIKCDKSNRKLLNGKEIDIYIPELNLGFEFNGLYWHSEIYKDRTYHLNKSKESQNLGIELFHIWEDDWMYKQDIVKSMILNKLGKTPNKIFARKCQISEINDNKLIRDFLETNHIQGFVGSKIKLGLFYNGELVSIMTFGNLRKSLGQKSQEGSYEMLRFCNKLNTNVVGGASKLFKYFIRNYQVNEVISYSDNSRGQGNLYKQLGFNLIHETEPNYYWVIDGIRHHRFNFRKDKLVKEGADPSKTEIQIMSEKGYYRIFDCGSKKWSYS